MVKVKKLVSSKNRGNDDDNNMQCIGFANTDLIKFDYDDMSLNSRDIGDADDYKLQGDMIDCIDLLAGRNIYLRSIKGVSVDSVNLPVAGVLSDALLVYINDNQVIAFSQVDLTSNKTQRQICVCYMHVTANAIKGLTAGHYAFIGDKKLI